MHFEGKEDASYLHDAANDGSGTEFQNQMGKYVVIIFFGMVQCHQ